jgi:hypothetical protein
VGRGGEWSCIRAFVRTAGESHGAPAKLTVIDQEVLWVPLLGSNVVWALEGVPEGGQSEVGSGFLHWIPFPWYRRPWGKNPSPHEEHWPVQTDEIVVALLKSTR